MTSPQVFLRSSALTWHSNEASLVMITTLELIILRELFSRRRKTDSSSGITSDSVRRAVHHPFSTQTAPVATKSLTKRSSRAKNRKGSIPCGLHPPRAQQSPNSEAARENVKFINKNASPTLQVIYVRKGNFSSSRAGRSHRRRVSGPVPVVFV